MSRPGDKGRRQELLAGDGPHIMAKAVELIGTVPGAHSFELEYSARDRELAEDEEPRPDEVVRWSARATVKRKAGKTRYEHTYEGTADYDPAVAGEPFAVTSHQHAGVLAVVALLEKLGANVVLLDQLRNPQ